MPNNALSESRLNNLVACLTPALALVRSVADGFDTPFFSAIVITTTSLIAALQRNQDECIELVERVHGILYSIVDFHIKSESRGSVSPGMLDHIGKFSATLQRITTFVQAQQEGNRLRQLFRQGEMSKLRKDCQTGLQEVLDAFKASNELNSGAHIYVF
ncbi:hypothetical protein C8F04DRAFT_1181952 [Mycena alexandri]|uniref:Uncharacterized protein n=1 Tax=Mycena alexandri TaxID=1745969 RepID=A0AAD6SXM0_9AGAR|nr:hypothetical protein C8F04DRAFT_1181952 [Mycena alexandri]